MKPLNTLTINITSVEWVIVDSMFDPGQCKNLAKKHAEKWSLVSTLHSTKNTIPQYCNIIFHLLLNVKEKWRTAGKILMFLIWIKMLQIKHILTN